MDHSRKTIALLIAMGCAACDSGGSNNTASGVQQSDPAALAAADAQAPGSDSKTAGRKPVRNLIFFLGDGYGIVPMTSTRIYAVGENGQLNLDKMPESAFVKTFSLDAQVTDSAPSMAAYMTGVKTRNEVLGMDGNTVAVAPGTDATTKVRNAVDNCPASANGAPATTLLELAIAKGRATGVVTTARLTHATPGATYSHVCHRNAEYEIARQAVPGGAGFNPALGNGVDVLMGGISQYWRPFNAQSEPAGRPDGRDLVAEMQARGYQFASDRAGLQKAATQGDGRMLALFDFAKKDGHMSYELDRDPQREPSLSEMTVIAMDRLARKGKGYFLMVEGGRIDHALHSTNAARALAEGKAFDEAIGAAIAKARETDPDLSETLIVATADHDHTMVMNGYAALTGPTKTGSPGILGLMRNYETPSAPALDAEGMPFTNLVFGNGENRITGPRAAQPALTDAQVSAKDYHQEAVVPMPVGGETHGGADVFLGAIGAGADSFHGMIDNTRVFGILRQESGL